MVRFGPSLRVVEDATPAFALHPLLSLSMNYLRGAVNAISAPYQYYKDINPATLTGAIDVIVITRPRVNQPDDASSTDQASSSDDDTELVCSPFHVRFGKWQVLRPADKKVSTVDLLQSAAHAHRVYRSMSMSTVTSSLSP